jgi:hypothetical protein
LVSGDLVERVSAQMVAVPVGEWDGSVEGVVLLDAAAEG